jgi:hypothetical protein
MLNATMNKPYLAYLLRMWQSGDPDHPVWLASLEDPHTRHVIYFHDLADLCSFLVEETRKSDSAPPYPVLPQNGHR